MVPGNDISHTQTNRSTGRLAKAIIGSPYELALDQRIYNLACFVAVTVSGVNLLIDVVLGLAWFVQLITFLAVLVFSPMYYLARFKNRMFKWGIIFCVLGFLSAYWFISQGAQGPIIFLYILASVGFITISDEKDHLLVIGTVIANLILLYMLEALFPQLVMPYVSEASKKADTIMTTVCSGLFTVFLVVEIKKEYGRERIKVEAYKKMEKALRSGEKRFRELIEGVSDISIQAYGEHRQVTFWNKASELLYGYSKEEALGKKIEDLIMPPELSEVTKKLYRRWIFDNVQIAPHELVLKDKFNNKVPVFFSPVMQETDLGKEIFCFNVDLGPVKKAEKEKEKLQSQLRQSQKMEAIGTLAGGIAHDFNNILQAISGYTELMAFDKEEDHPDHENLKAIHEATSRAESLVKQLLVFSRKAETLKQPLKINQEVELAKKLLMQTIPKMIEIETRLTHDLWSAMVDPVQIEQVILNLGSNAAHAMPDGGKMKIETLNVTITDDFPGEDIKIPGDYVLLRITDTGHGMDSSTKEKIFEPFYTTKEVGKGTGLGLASVYGIVKNHKGYISCQSEVDKGTVFKLYFPALRNNFDPGLTDETDELEGGTETILVVDDEKTVQYLAFKGLQRFGYTLLKASRGDQALKIYKTTKDKIDLVLLDVNMPGMGGHKCLRELLLIDPEANVILSSGHSTESNLKDSLKLGASGYIGKPYKLDELATAVRKTLDA